MIIQVQEADFDSAGIHRQMLGSRSDVGALISFIGLVRDMPGEYLRYMTLEHYAGMTEKSLQAIAQQAVQRWDIVDCAIVHRIGRLKPADQIVLVSVLSAHRKAAFSACEFMMDYLKTEAPFWKKVTNRDGEHWVEAKKSDTAARQRW